MARDIDKAESRRPWTFSQQQPTLVAPLENFFGNDFLVLLYSSFLRRRLDELQALRDALHKVVDEALTDRQRGAAALFIARNLADRQGYRRQSDDGPTRWYGFAAERGLIEAYDAHAEAILSAVNLEVKGLPLPTLISTSNGGERKRVEYARCCAQDLEEAVERVLYAMQDEFVDFDDEDLSSAFDIVLQYTCHYTLRQDRVQC